MTIQSLAWALDQAIPGTAKLVLLGLANYADDATGEVHLDADGISRVAVVQPTSLPRYLAALERNQYLDKTETAQGRIYWLAMSRESMAPWSWSADDGPEHAESPSSPSRRDNAPVAFSRGKQVEAREAVAPPKSESTPPQIPVIEGTDAFRAWTAHDRGHGRVPPFTHVLTLKDGKVARGFYKPTMFPPRQDGIDDVEGVA